METFQDFSNSVSIIGLRNVCGIQVPLTRRVLWITLLLSGVSTTIYLVSDRITTYMSHPRSINAEIGHNSELEFPTVTVCLLRFYGLDRLEAKGENLSHHYEAFMHTAFGYHHNRTLPDIVPLMSPEEIDEFFAESARSLVDFCVFMGQACPEDSLAVSLTDLGTCMAFNGGKRGRYMVHNVGVQQGLTLGIKVNRSDVTRAASNAGYSKGFALVTSYDEEPVYNIRRYSMILPVGMEVRIGMQKSVTSLLASDESPCHGDSTTAPYSQNSCLDSCLADMVYQQCSCAIPGLLRYAGQRRCRTAYEWNCNIVILNGFTMNATVQHQCQCLEACVRKDNNMVITYSQLADTFLPDGVDYSVLQMYYSSLDVVSITQHESYQFWDMMSDIGGALGLFIGSALFTLFEIIDFFLCACLNKCGQKHVAPKKELLKGHYLNRALD